MTRTLQVFFHLGFNGESSDRFKMQTSPALAEAERG
jgi:hypothetical protein